MVIVDALLGRGLVTPAQLSTLVEDRRLTRGWRPAARVFELADGRAQSPAESQIRIRLILAGLPRPVLQHPVAVAGGVVLHPDLAWPDYRVALEYDGTWHDERNQFHRDRRRLNLLTSAGWLVLHVTSRTWTSTIAREVGAALRSRGWPGR